VLQAIHQELINLYQQGHIMHFMKVPAHSGVVGNVVADHVSHHDCSAETMQKKMGQYLDIEDWQEVTITEGNDPYKELAWAYTSPPGQPDKAKSWQLRDLKSTLKTHMHRMHVTGTSNTDSIYYKSWQQRAADCDVQASNHFMTCCEHGVRKRMLQYRTGTLPTNKMLNRFAPTKHSALCPMCHSMPDSGHHAVAGCTMLTSTIDACRHNTAGRLIMKAIATGLYGTSLYAADVGRKDLMDQEDLEHLDWGLPDWLKKKGQEHTKWPSRPDGLMILNAKNDGDAVVDGLMPQVKTDSAILLLEVKYCADYKRMEKIADCIEQHRATVALLKQWYPLARIEVCPLVLGTGGSIYLDFKRRMEMLGVKGNAYRLLANKLNANAAVFVDKAMKFRWASMRSRYDPG
jgi:hypothetical protein